MTDNRWFVRSIFTIGLVLLGLVPAVATAQEATTVSGQVKSSPGGTPLVGAIVSIPSLRVNATTGNDGRYRLVLPAGSTGAVQLSARRIGYQTNSVPLTLTGASVEQDISLAEGAIELTQVVVTALGIEREPHTLSYAAQTVSGDRISSVRGLPEESRSVPSAARAYPSWVNVWAAARGS